MIQENSVNFGNNIDLLKNVKDCTIQCIYIDPPFFTQKDHSLYSEKHKKEMKFSDKWINLSDYLKYIKNLLSECKKKLKDDGTIFLHCDKTASHHIRVLLDEVFGGNNFINEIIWTYRRWSNSREGLLNSHQNIYFYAKSKSFKFNKLFTDYSPTTNIDQILQSRERNENGKSIYQTDTNGNVILGKEKKGVPLSDVWEIPYLNPKAKERVGYPTQKPYLLLKQIIEISTSEGDIVLDPCCGSGTTCVTAKLLNRKYIGIDIANEAIDISKSRLDNPVVTSSALLKNGKEDYYNQDIYKVPYLEILNAIPVQRNKGIDGFLKEYFNNKPVAVKIQGHNQTLQSAVSELLNSTQSKKCEKLILIKTNDSTELSLFNNEIKDDRLTIVDSFSLIASKLLENDKSNSLRTSVCSG